MRREEIVPANFGRRAGVKAKRANTKIIAKTLLVFGFLMLTGCNSTVNYEKHAYNSASEYQGGK